MISKHRELFIFICMLLIVPLAGEPRIHPFGNEFSSFRVSFGSPMFLLFLLWLRNVPMAVSGLAIGIAVVLFRGALDVRARRITEQMKIAAAHALAQLAREEVPQQVRELLGREDLAFGPDYIIPSPFDPRLREIIPAAVAKAAIESGVAPRPE